MSTSPNASSGRFVHPNKTHGGVLWQTLSKKDSQDEESTDGSVGSPTNQEAGPEIVVEMASKRNEHNKASGLAPPTPPGAAKPASVAGIFGRGTSPLPGTARPAPRPSMTSGRASPSSPAFPIKPSYAGPPSLVRQPSMSVTVEDMEKVMAEPAPRRRKSIPEIMSELKSMKGDGIGRVSIDEVVNLLQDTQDAYAPKSFKHSMKWAILAVLAVMVNAGLVLGIVELAKDTKIKEDAELATKTGQVVKVASVQKHATLLDLPLLGTSELNKIDAVTYVTSKGMSHLGVVGYDVDPAGMLTLTTGDPDRVIKLTTNSAVVVSTDRFTGAITKSHIDVEPDAARRRRLAAGDSSLGSCLKNGACLYSNDEMLTLNRNSDHPFYTEAYVDVATSSVDMSSSEVWSFLKKTNGTFFGEGSVDDGDFTIRFAKWLDGTKAVSIERDDAMGLFYGDVLFNYNGSSLVSCSDKDVFKDLLGELEQGGMGAMSFDVSVVEEGDESAIPTDFMPAAPSLSDCQSVYEHNLAAADDSDGRRARRLTNDDHPARAASRVNMQLYIDQISEALDTGNHDLEGHPHTLYHDNDYAHDHDRAAADAHADATYPTDATDSRRLSQGRGRRRLATTYAQWAIDSYSDSNCDFTDGNLCVYNPQTCVFVFRGSDDAYDWISNAQGVFVETSVNDRTMHGGFVSEFNKAKSFISGKSCANPTFIGHSLGGAIAEVARVHFGAGTVITYGAPQLFDNNDGCYHTGERYYHEDDPVAGNLFGLLVAYWHQSGAIEIKETTSSYYNSCHGRNWMGVCTDCECGSCSSRWYCETTSTSLESKSCTDNSGSWDTDFGAHSMASQYSSNAVRA